MRRMMALFKDSFRDSPFLGVLAFWCFVISVITFVALLITLMTAMGFTRFAIMFCASALVAIISAVIYRWLEAED